MRQNGITVTIGALFFCGISAVVALGQDLDPREVRQALEAGTDYLKKTQHQAGNWPEYPGHPGLSALCTLALLNAGVPPEDPVVRRALQFLRGKIYDRTYAVSLQTMVFCVAEPAKDLQKIRRNVLWLEKAQSGSGAWSYLPEGGQGDPSNAQFAVLALHEAERVGRRFGQPGLVSATAWRRALAYWKGKQRPDGSWGYIDGRRSSGSMTCAGIASLVLSSDILNVGDAAVVDGEVQCCGTQRQDDAVQQGLDWLTRNFTVRGNPNRGQTYHFYYLYALERVGRITNRRFIGNHDWYREGADVLLHRRSPDALEGFWRGSGHAEDNALVCTSMALLFLSKGRRPVLLAKLRHGPGEDWNRHRGDAANLTRYVEQKWERDLTWQVLDFEKVQTVEDLLQSPVLYLSGRDGLEFSPGQRKLLRMYVDRGGFLFAESCCEGDGFDQAFRALIKDMFPEAEYQLRLLPPEHPIWRAEEPVDPAHLRRLWGVDAGCRTSVVYCDQDLSCYWELARVRRGHEYPEEVQDSIQAALAIGANVLAYATSRELKYKDEIPVAAQQDAPLDPLARGELRVAKIRHPGGCDAAPLAVANLVQAAGENVGLGVSSNVPLISFTDEQLFSFALVFVHGRNAFQLSALERKRLREFVERGGIVLADAVCSNEAFAESLRREMRLAFPDRSWQAVPPEHPMFTAEFGGSDLRTITLRQPQASVADNPLRARRVEVAPRLEGVFLEDRWGVLFSPYDISCALENQASLECPGYLREDAALLGINLILYSFLQ